jgi:hypothetical protein
VESRNLLLLAGKGGPDGKTPGSRSLSNALFRKREARAFPPSPLGKCGAGALARVLSLPRHRSQGIPEGCGSRKLNSIIDAQQEEWLRGERVA